MYRRIFILYLLCGFSLCLFAAEKKDSVEIIGRVMNNFTYELIPSVKIEIMDTDSLLVDELYSSQFMFNGEPMNIARVNGLKLPCNKQFIFRFTHSDYETTYFNYKTKAGSREYRVRMKDVYMQKDWHTNLEEVTITATKIKMVMKGDTVIYNADAFQLSNGSMLDALIRQLPGVQLNGSRITVNGRFVNSLLVNGEDFFRGDAAIALKNLPAYMVDKVKVYEKAPEYEYITGRDETRELPLVMDVNLKREYSVGWVANAEAGIGTHERWLGRLFGLRFTDNSRLALFGNVNNINDTREPGTSGSWNSAWVASGITTTKLGGAELLVNDRERVWKYNGNIKTLQEDIVDSQTSSSENFLLSGNSYGRSKSETNTDRLKIMSEHRFEVKLSKVFLDFKAYGEFADGRVDNFSSAAEFSQSPNEAYRCATLDSLYGKIYRPYNESFLINYHYNKGLEKIRYFKGDILGNAYIDVPGTPDFMNINVGGNYNNSSKKAYSHYFLNIANEGDNGNTFLNRHADNPVINYNLFANVDYNYRGSILGHSLRIVPKYDYCYTYTDEVFDYYLLNRNTGWDNEANAPQMGELPSSRDELQQAFDMQNSFSSDLHKSVHTPEVRVTYFFFDNRHNITFTPKLRVQHESLSYKRASVDTLFSRTTVAFEPYIHYGFDDFALEYSFKQTEVSMLRLLNVRDNTNPLIIREGNPYLKNTKIHNVKIHRYFWNYATKYNLSLTGYYNLHKDAVAQSIVYDAKTGVRTYRPQNIDGNWNVGGAVDFTRAIDKNQLFFISTKTSTSYANSADYIAIEGVAESTRSSVRSLSLSQGIEGKYAKGGYNVTLKGDARFNYLTSDRADFENIKCVDFNYGVSAFWELPFKIQLATDFTVYSRRGYNDALMNDNNIVWNARIERAFLKGGNLLFALEGFDILGQLSNVQRTLNAQGRVETWYNSVPRYAMLRFVYRLNVKPRKK